MRFLVWGQQLSNPKPTQQPCIHLLPHTRYLPSKPSEKDPHRNIQPILMDANAAWKQGDGVDFLPELSEIRQRIQVNK